MAAPNNKLALFKLVNLNNLIIDPPMQNAITSVKYQG